MGNRKFVLVAKTRLIFCSVWFKYNLTLLCAHRGGGGKKIQEHIYVLGGGWKLDKENTKAYLSPGRGGDG